MSDKQSAYYYGLMVARNGILGDNERKELRDEILTAVHQDPLITEKVNITVTFPKDDEKGITLEGKLGDAKAKERLKEIAMQRTPQDIKIYDNVIVSA